MLEGVLGESRQAQRSAVAESTRPSKRKVEEVDAEDLFEEP